MRIRTPINLSYDKPTPSFKLKKQYMPKVSLSPLDQIRQILLNIPYIIILLFKQKLSQLIN